MILVAFAFYAQFFFKYGFILLKLEYQPLSLQVPLRAAEIIKSI